MPFFAKIPGLLLGPGKCRSERGEAILIEKACSLCLFLLALIPVVLFFLIRELMLGGGATEIGLPILDLILLAGCLFLLRLGHFDRVRNEALILAAGLHLSFGILVSVQGNAQLFVADISLHAGVIILLGSAFASPKVFAFLVAIESASLLFLPFLLPEISRAQFLRDYQEIHLQLVALDLCLGILVWIMRGLFNDAVKKVEAERKANLELNAQLEQKVLERTAEAIAARGAAEAANSAKSEFLIDMAHEIRTPLHGILGVADLMLEDDLTARQRERVGSVIESGNQLMGVLTDIGEFNRICDGNLEINRETLHLPSFVKEIMASITLQARSSGLDSALWVCEGLPEYVEADALRLRQILMNMGRHALRSTDEGEIRLAVDLMDGMLAFVVQDTGTVLSKERLRDLSESLANGSVAQTRQASDIFLAIAHGLALRMGGRMEISCMKGFGENMTILLPILASRPVEMPPRDLAAAARTPLTGMRVLLVDDNAINRKVAEEILSRQDCLVSVAEHGRMALSLLERHSFDLVLMDCHMPVMDGIEAVRILRGHRNDPAHRLAAQIPVIAVTADPSQENRAQCLAAGMDDVLFKPFRSSQLCEVAEAWFGQKHVES